MRLLKRASSSVPVPLKGRRTKLDHSISSSGFIFLSHFLHPSIHPFDRSELESNHFLQVGCGIPAGKSENRGSRLRPCQSGLHRGMSNLSIAIRICTSLATLIRAVLWSGSKSKAAPPSSSWQRRYHGGRMFFSGARINWVLCNALSSHDSPSVYGSTAWSSSLTRARRAVISQICMQPRASLRIWQSWLLPPSSMTNEHLSFVLVSAIHRFWFRPLLSLCVCESVFHFPLFFFPLSDLRDMNMKEECSVRALVSMGGALGFYLFAFYNTMPIQSVGSIW